MLTTVGTKLMFLFAIVWGAAFLGLGVLIGACMRMAGKANARRGLLVTSAGPTISRTMVRPTAPAARKQPVEWANAGRRMPMVVAQERSEPLKVAV
jgi:hypothetical protein